MGNPKTLRRALIATLAAIYLVILAGSVVRMTGSGMGCPDWPKCFGQWIPPTDVSELPDTYEADYLTQRKQKLDKYIALIDAIGNPEVAQAMREDPTLLESEPFDAVGTWIEYVNRLFGFLSGNLLLLSFIISLWWLKRKPMIPILVFIALIAIGFQAWLGSVVVATNLLPWTITIHMVVAFLLIALLVYVHHRVPSSDTLPAVRYKGLLACTSILTLVQVVLGTQVRQEIDYIAKQTADRSTWIAQLSSDFEIHRSFSIIILLLTAFFIYRNREALQQRYKPLYYLGALLILEVLVGIILAYLDMPKLAQPTHLLVATLFFGVQCWLLCLPSNADDLDGLKLEGL